MNKPLIIMLNETKTEIASAISNALRNNIPCYLLEPIVSDLLAQIREGARNELQMAQEQMKNEQSSDSVNTETE